MNIVFRYRNFRRVERCRKTSGFVMSYRSTLGLGVAVSFGLAMLGGCATKPAAVAPAPQKAASAAPAATPYTPPAQASGPTGPVPGSEQDFLASGGGGDRAYFDYDQYTVRADAIPVLNAQAAWLTRYPAVKVQVQGNADERGTEEYNMALGARRAQSVRDYLMSHGVAAARIATISFGKERPIDLGQNDQAFAHNRNAHTALVGGAS
jgi:peptidoglycan-associated lipoprotein